MRLDPIYEKPPITLKKAIKSMTLITPFPNYLLSMNEYYHKSVTERRKNVWEKSVSGKIMKIFSIVFIFTFSTFLYRKK